MGKCAHCCQEMRCCGTRLELEIFLKFAALGALQHELAKLELLDLSHVFELDALLAADWPLVCRDLLIAQRILLRVHPPRLPQHHLPAAKLEVALLRNQGFTRALSNAQRWREWRRLLRSLQSSGTQAFQTARSRPSARCCWAAGASAHRKLLHDPTGLLEQRLQIV